MKEIPFKNDGTTQTSIVELKLISLHQSKKKKMGPTWLTELVSKIVCKYARPNYNIFRHAQATEG